MTCNRRTFLGAMGGAMIGSVLAPTGALAFQQESKPFSWTPHTLDPKACAPVAYDGYWYNGYGCCYGVFYGIVGMLGEKYGAPYSQFPFTMMEMGKSGISDWGTICGALLGAASAYALFWGRKERDPMVTELYRWYETTAFPLFDPGGAAQGVKGAVPPHAGGSVLCHVSVSSWAHATGNDANSKMRQERCSRITADVCVKAVEIMNAKIGGTFAPVLAATKATEYCGSCHDKGKESPIVKGRMDCTPCHGGSVHVQDKSKNHP